MRHDTLKKVLAFFVLLLIFCTIVSLILCLIRKADPGVILAHLFCLMIVPCIFYVFRLFRPKK